MLVPGAPRILSFGAGIDTEGIVRSKASWKNARLGRLGSLLDLTAMGSFRTQSLSTTSDWYFLPEVSRKYISSTVELKHENQPQYHTLSVIGQVGFATTFDSRTAGGSLFVGPSMNFVRDYSLAGPYNAKFLFLESRLAIRSHDFEYFASNPNTGYNLNFIADLSHPEVLTDTSAQRFNVNGEFLWNLKNYDPPLAVFAVRAGFGTLFVSDSPFSSRLLPGNFYQYLGGSVDLRGFSLKELPRNQSSGARTSGFAGFEARLANTIPYGIEPFAFFDIGALGDQPMSFDLPIYTSPGIGVRWKTPIGTFRTTLAHGFSGDSQKDHWQPYLSFGEEF